MNSKVLEDFLNGKVIKVNANDVINLLNLINDFNINTVAVQAGQYENCSRHFYCKILNEKI